MRYRIDQTAQQAAASSTDSFIVGSVFLGLIIGVILVLAGMRGRQYWIAIWGGSLVAASIMYLGAAALGMTG